MSGIVTVQGASFTLAVSSLVCPKNILRRVQREYPAVIAVEITPRMAIASRYGVAVLVALMNPPWNMKNSEKKPFVEGSPSMARNPMNAAVAVTGILEAR